MENKFEKEQNALMAETNKHKSIPVDIRLYQKTKQEKELLKAIKRSLKNG